MFDQFNHRFSDAVPLESPGFREAAEAWQESFGPDPLIVAHKLHLRYCEGCAYCASYARSSAQVSYDAAGRPTGQVFRAAQAVMEFLSS